MIVRWSSKFHRPIAKECFHAWHDPGNLIMNGICVRIIISLNVAFPIPIYITRYCLFRSRRKHRSALNAIGDCLVCVIPTVRCVGMSVGKPQTAPLPIIQLTANCTPLQSLPLSHTRRGQERETSNQQINSDSTDWRRQDQATHNKPAKLLRVWPHNYNYNINNNNNNYVWKQTYINCIFIINRYRLLISLYVT